MIVVGGEALVDLIDDSGTLRAVAGGGPFNTAVALGRLGLDVGFLGAISRDPNGIMLVEELRAAGVDGSLVRRTDAETPTALVKRRRDGGHDYVFTLDGRAFADIAPNQLPELPDRAWAIHLGTLSLALDPPAAAYEALVGREAGRRKIILDPNVRPAVFDGASRYRQRFECLVRLADLVKLSDDDAQWIYPELTVPEVLERLLDLGAPVVAITRGADGAIAGTAHATVEVAGRAVAVVDTVGAGDSFGAALVAALVDERAFGPRVDGIPDEPALRRALSYAVAASAITCTRTGAVPPTRAEIEALLGEDLRHSRR